MNLQEEWFGTFVSGRKDRQGAVIWTTDEDFEAISLQTSSSTPCTRMDKYYDELGNEKTAHKILRQGKGILCSLVTLVVAFLIAHAPVAFNLNRANHVLSGVGAAMVLICGGLCAYILFRKVRDTMRIK